MLKDIQKDVQKDIQKDKQNLLWSKIICGKNSDLKDLF